MADIPNPEPVRIPDRPRKSSGLVPGVDPTKLDPRLGPDPDLGIEKPGDRPAGSTAAPTPEVASPADDPIPGVPALRVVEDLDPDAFDPEPAPFDVAVDGDPTDLPFEPRPKADGSARDDGAADDDGDDDDFDGDFDPALAPPPGYRPPE